MECADSRLFEKKTANKIRIHIKCESQQILMVHA